MEPERHCCDCPAAVSKIFPCTINGQERSLSQVVLDTIPAMVAVLSPEGVIRTVNRAWQSFGLQNGSTDRCFGVGSNYLDVCREADPATAPEAHMAADAIHAVLKGGCDATELEYVCRTPSGDRHFMLSVNAVREPSCQGAIVLHSDITDRRRAEAKALSAERMAVAGRMAAGVAHEINNPLAAIKNAFDLLKEAVDPLHRHAGFAPLIEMEIDRIARVVRQMLDLHRRDSDRLQRVNAADVVREVVLLLKPAARRQGIRLEVESPESACWVMVLNGPLRQVLYNLIQNAIDASVGNSDVVVVRIEPDAEQTVVLSVTDGGPGIAPATLEQIFEPFFTTKQGGPTSGTGLGLSVCKNLVESMGGLIGVVTAVGKGTTFRVVLPAPTEA